MHLFYTDEDVAMNLTVKTRSLFFLEKNFTVSHGKNRKINSHAAVIAWKKVCPFLANNDGACACELSFEELYASAFCLRIAAVSRRASGFFVCHSSCILIRIAVIRKRGFIVKPMVFWNNLQIKYAQKIEKKWRTYC
jgi:hypothetical protein